MLFNFNIPDDTVDRQKLKFSTFNFNRSERPQSNFKIVTNNMTSNHDGDGYGLNKIRPSLRMLDIKTIHKRYTCRLFT